MTPQEFAAAQVLVDDDGWEYKGKFSSGLRFERLIMGEVYVMDLRPVKDV